jgi:hypothetical protein
VPRPSLLARRPDVPAAFGSGPTSLPRLAPSSSFPWAWQCRRQWRGGGRGGSGRGGGYIYGMGSGNGGGILHRHGQNSQVVVGGGGVLAPLPGGSATIGYDMSGHHTLSRLMCPEPKIGPHLHHRRHPSHFELGRRARFFLTLVKTGPIWTIAVRLRRAPRDAFKLKKDRAVRAKRYDSNFLWETAQQHPKPAYTWLEG